MSRPEPIPPNVDVGLRSTVEHSADVLIITDGDADRLGVGDEKGHFIDQLRVYALMAYYLLEVRGERGPIVKTLSSTNMLNKLGKLYGVPVYEVGVGFKYVAPKMLETHAMIGGEEFGLATIALAAVVVLFVFDLLAWRDIEQYVSAAGSR